MCGILGIVAAPGDEVTVPRAEILRMRDAMEMRGPDSAGLFQRRNVALAHRRLAIRDIAGGGQPWISDDKQTVLVYNGEIYNDAYLRSELTSLGHRFRSRCDTEVVLAAYRQWGRECVHRFEGMFAFGIYDFRDESLLLARDRFGVKPLFLSEIDGTLVFASSIPALLKHPRLTKAPNLSVVSHYLTTFRITLGRQTVFSGIHQLLPGELLYWNCGRIQVEQYWNYSADEDGTLEYAEAVDQLDAGLRNSVQKRLASDVPVGMFLSGGVDSNTIACLVNERSSAVGIAKCGGGEDDASDDFAYARRCANHVGFDFGEVRVTADEYLETWNWMTDRYATPLSTPSDVILYHLAREMKKSVGVVLGGEGADELLSGYAVQHWAGVDFDRSRQISAGRWTGSPHAKRAFQISLLNQYGRAKFASETDHYFALNSLIPIAAKPALFREPIWKQAGEDGLLIDHYSRYFEELGEMPTQRKHSILLHRLNLESLLSRLDSSTMLAGLEARVPYTDHSLVEKMFAVPAKFRIDVAHDERAPYLASAELESRGSLRSKRPLRTFAERLMPADLAHRKKASFPTPVERWLSGPWKTWAQETLANSPFGHTLFQPQALDELAGNIPQAGMWLWPLLNVMQWGDRQFG